jgi:hypothetical protein
MKDFGLGPPEQSKESLEKRQREVAPEDASEEECNAACVVTVHAAVDTVYVHTRFSTYPSTYWKYFNSTS